MHAANGIVAIIELDARDVDRLTRALDRASHMKRDSIEYEIIEALAVIVPEYMAPYVIAAAMAYE